MAESLAPLETMPAARAPRFRIPYYFARVLTAPVFPFFPASVLATRVTYPTCAWDEAVTRAHFRRHYHREIDLENPMLFSEKISWLKLYDRRPIQKIMADKVDSHALVREKGFAEILLERYGVWDSPEEVPLEELPETFALKASHGWKMNWFRRAGDPLPVRQVRRMMRRWLRTDHSLKDGEWQYRGTRRRLLAEPLLNFPGGIAAIYRFYCFGGVPKVVKLNAGHFSESRHAGAYFDLDWRKLPFMKVGQPGIDGAARPAALGRMAEIASALSAGQPFLRVDLFEHEGRILLSELSLYPDGGAHAIDLQEWDVRLGSWIDLPRATP